MPSTPAAANRWIVVVAVAAAALVLAAQLLVPPVAGLADNGDYHRVMGSAGFEHSTDSYTERYFSFLRTQYRISPIAYFHSGYHTSETALALIARFVSPASWRGGLFDIRVLGGVHILLFLFALGMLLSACRELAPAAQCVAAAVLVFFFTDVGYAGLFNSFYSQTASLLFLLLLVAVAAAAMALALCVFAAWYGRSTPMTLREAALYQVVFAEVLPHSPAPDADIAALGLDPEWMKYSGTNAFQSDSPLTDPTFRVRFMGSVGYKKILRLYLENPRRLAERVHRVSAKMWTLRPSYGNLERSEAFPTLTLTHRFAAWSRIRLALFGPHALAWLALLFSANAVAAVATYRRASKQGRLFRQGLLAAVLMSAVAFGVCLLTNAPPDLARVFYVAQALCDLLLVADAAWLVQAMGRPGTRA